MAKTQIYPAFPTSCLSAFHPWWNGLDRISRPAVYQIGRNRLRNERYNIEAFVPKFLKRTLAFRTGRSGKGEKVKQEYWCGLKPDGSYYILGLSCTDELRARMSYVQKLCYWGRRPTTDEDEQAMQFIPDRDIFDMMEPISLETPVRGCDRYRIGEALGIL